LRAGGHHRQRSSHGAVRKFFLFGGVAAIARIRKTIARRESTVYLFPLILEFNAAWTSVGAFTISDMLG
jgi:hypothetical protein